MFKIPLSYDFFIPIFLTIFGLLCAVSSYAFQARPASRGPGLVKKRDSFSSLTIPMHYESASLSPVAKLSQMSRRVLEIAASYSPKAIRSQYFSYSPRASSSEKPENTPSSPQMKSSDVFTPRRVFTKLCFKSIHEEDAALTPRLDSVDCEEDTFKDTTPSVDKVLSNAGSEVDVGLGQLSGTKASLQEQIRQCSKSDPKIIITENENFDTSVDNTPIVDKVLLKKHSMDYKKLMAQGLIEGIVSEVISGALGEKIPTNMADLEGDTVHLTLKTVASDVLQGVISVGRKSALTLMLLGGRDVIQNCQANSPKERSKDLSSSQNNKSHVKIAKMNPELNSKLQSLGSQEINVKRVLDYVVWPLLVRSAAHTAPAMAMHFGADELRHFMDGCF